jgi:hypothetical protein
MPWPAKSFVCIDCRTLLSDAACPAGGRHRVTSLAETEPREKLLDAVWGPKSVRQRLVEAGKVGAGSAAASTGFHACDVWGALELDWFIVVFLGVAILWFLGAWIVGIIKRRRARRSGCGARAPGLQVGRMRGVPGTVRAARSEPDPVTSMSCVAYGAELRDRGGVMLRDAATVGFDLELVTGETVRVPPGAIVIDMQRAPEVGAELDEYRGRIDPVRDEVLDLEAFPGDEIRLRLIKPGDTVEFLGEVEPQPVGEAGYRDAAKSVLVPRGLVRLRPC